MCRITEITSQVTDVITSHTMILLSTLLRLTAMFDILPAVPQNNSHVFHTKVNFLIPNYARLICPARKPTNYGCLDGIQKLGLAFSCLSCRSGRLHFRGFAAQERRDMATGCLHVMSLRAGPRGMLAAGILCVRSGKFANIK